MAFPPFTWNWCNRFNLLDSRPNIHDLNLAGGKAQGRDYTLTGLLTGLAITTKYLAVIVALFKRRKDLSG